MNRELRYMINQQFLNQAFPPPEHCKIFGNTLLYDLFHMHMFFKIKDRANRQRQQEIYEDEQVEIIDNGPLYQGPSMEEIKENCKDSYNKGKQFTQNLLNKLFGKAGD